MTGTFTITVSNTATDPCATASLTPSVISDLTYIVTDDALSVIITDFTGAPASCNVIYTLTLDNI